MAKREKYNWEFQNVGGTSRVKIRNGADIANLDKLDKKLWTVLSCPVKGLEIDETSLAYIDCDSDGKIRVNDIIQTSEWMNSILKSMDLLLEGKDSFDIENFNQENPAGKKLYNSAKQILVNLGKEGTVISLADTKDITAIFAKTRFNGDGVITAQTPENDGEKAMVLGGIWCPESKKDEIFRRIREPHKNLQHSCNAVFRQF